MNTVLEIKEGAFSSPQPVSSSQSNNGSNMNVSPSILLIIIIIAVIFFISGLLHLLVRFLFRRNSDRSPDDLDGLTALQGQLQQLFNLHDCGVDQSFIDTLPVFNYEAITGVKDPFDCAVCLCEFEPEDKLRLLPKCSHAFHMNCIDTWLLSHSTCPICRASLVSDFPQNGHCSPVVRILESGSESYREREDGSGIGIGNAHVSSQCDDVEVGAREDEISEGKVVSIKLGKYRSVGGGDDGIGEVNEEARRCFSMGSFAYVMDEKSSLRVAISPSNKKTILPLKPGHRLAMSECGCDSTREFNGFEAFNILERQSGGNEINKSIVTSKRESISVSKIWLRERKDEESVERRAFSFRFPVAAGESNTKNGGGRSSLNNLDEVDHQSFGRRTLLWLMGRQNKVVHSSFSTNV